MSTGRCGSTFLSDVLDRHPEVLSISEFLFSMSPDVFPAAPMSASAFAAKLEHRDPVVTSALRAHAEPPEFRYPVDAGGRFDREAGVPAIAIVTLPHLTEDPDTLYDDVVAFARSRPSSAASDHYRAVFEWLRDRFARRIWVERTGGSLQWLPTLDRSFGDARFVHLYRDGRETAISMSKRDNFRLMFAHADLEAFARDHGSDAPLPDPLARLTPDAFELEALHAYEVPLERYGLHWSSIVLRGLRALRSIDPERVLSVAYETLVAEPRHVLAEVTAFLGVGAPADWLEWAAGEARPHPSNWLRLPQAERDRLDSVCRIANARLYGPDGPPLIEV